MFVRGRELQAGLPPVCTQPAPRSFIGDVSLQTLLISGLPEALAF